MAKAKPSALIIGSIYAIAGLIGGYVIMRISMFIGGAFVSTMTTPSSHAELTAEVVVTGNLIAFVLYQAMVGHIMRCSARIKKIGWKFQLFLFSAVPFTIFLLGGNVSPQIRRFLLTIIAALAVYHFLVVRYQHYQAIKRGDGRTH